MKKRENLGRDSPKQLGLFSRTRYLSVEEVAEMLGVPKSFIYRRTCRGHPDAMPSYRFGGHLRFREDEIREWIELHRRESEPVTIPKLVAARRSRSSGSTAKRHPSPGGT